MLSFRIGVTDKWKTKDGEKKEHTEWVSAELFGKRAEALAPFILRGGLVAITGSMRTNVTEKGGEKKYFTKIRVDDVALLGGKKEADAKSAAFRNGGTSGHGGSAKHAGTPLEEDEIPFIFDATLYGSWDRP